MYCVSLCFLPVQRTNNAPIEDRAEAEWNGSPDIRNEFGSKEAFVAFRKAEEDGRVKRYARS